MKAEWVKQIRTFIPGVPQPKGSKVALGKRHMIEGGTNKSRARKKAWATAVKETIREELIGRVISTAVNIEVTFLFPIPKSRMRGKNALRSGEQHTQKPDSDKLLRNLFDPIKEAGLIKDDCVIASGRFDKRWCQEGCEGAHVVITWS